LSPRSRAWSWKTTDENMLPCSVTASAGMFSARPRPAARRSGRRRRAARTRCGGGGGRIRSGVLMLPVRGSGFLVPGSVRGSGFDVRRSGSVQRSWFRVLLGVRGSRCGFACCSKFRVPGSGFCSGFGVRRSGVPALFSVPGSERHFGVPGSAFRNRTNFCELRTPNPRTPNPRNPEPRTPNPEREPGTRNPEPRTASTVLTPTLSSTAASTRCRTPLY
jgi:hypothetical protein